MNSCSFQANYRVLGAYCEDAAAKKSLARVSDVGGCRGRCRPQRSSYSNAPEVYTVQTQQHQLGLTAHEIHNRGLITQKVLSQDFNVTTARSRVRRANL